MLLSLTKPVISLFIGEQVVAAQCRGKGKKAILSDIRSVQSCSSDAEIEAALEQVLLGRRRGVGVEVTIGQPHIFYITLPWSHELSRYDARVTAARTRFIELFGERYSRHKVCVSPTRFGRPTIAAFMAPELMDTINRLIMRGGFRIRSIEPQLAGLWNMLRGQMKTKQGVFEVIESGFVTKARYEHGLVTEISVAPTISRGQSLHVWSQAHESDPVYRIDTRGVLFRNGIVQWNPTDSLTINGIEGGLLSCVLRRGIA